MEEKKANVVSPLNAILVFILTMGLSLIIELIIYLTIGLGVALIIGELLLLLIPLGFLILKHVDVKNYVGFNPKPKYILLGIGFSIILLFLNVISVAILTAIFGASQTIEEVNNLYINLIQSPEGLIALAIGFSLAGICEEFLFRGFLQNALSRRFSFIPAVIVSSVTFGFFHFDPQLVYIIGAIIGGLLLGYIYNRWHSLIVSMTAHATMDLIVLIILLLSLKP
jgi:uncharacterized protein